MNDWFRVLETGTFKSMLPASCKGLLVCHPYRRGKGKITHEAERKGGQTAK
jgi:hypothetical protein